MHSAIWKYKILHRYGINEIQMPKGADILSVGNQQEQLCVWARVDPGADIATRRIACFLTGPSGDFMVGETGRFLDTVLFDNGAFVVHVFEVVP